MDKLTPLQIEHILECSKLAFNLASDGECAWGTNEMYFLNMFRRDLRPLNITDDCGHNPPSGKCNHCREKGGLSLIGREVTPCEPVPTEDWKKPQRTPQRKNQIKESDSILIMLSIMQHLNRRDLNE